MAQQTAVEWLEKQFDKYTSGGVNVPNNKIFKLTEKAKAMEKEQIMKAAKVILFASTGPGDTAAEQYYNETYKK
tara:strand:+ start:43 stop:264 length:222 start_codon:yes stop_codon:yes gene_type:complete